MENTSTAPVTKSSQGTGHIQVESIRATFEELYLKKDYKGAASYLLQNKEQFDSGIFYYNLGTVYSKMGDYPAARFHLEKSIKENYVNSASLNNLTYVRSQLEVDDLSTSTNWGDQFMNYSLFLPSTAYLMLSLFLLLWGVWLLKTKKLLKKTSIALFVLVIIAPMIFSSQYLNKIHYAVALKDIPLYEGPSKVFSEKGKLKAGSKVILGDFREGWFYVKFPISLTGWINKDQLGLY